MKMLQVVLSNTTTLGGISMSEKEFREICELDNIAEEAGGFVDSNVSSASEVHYDYRSIISYCKERNIEPIDMTIREMQKFIIA